MVHLQDYNDPPRSHKPVLIVLAVTAVTIAGIWWLKHSTRVSAAAPAAASAPAAMTPAAPEPVKKPPAPAPAPAVIPASPGTSGVAPAVSGPIPPSLLEEASAVEKAGQLAEAREKYLSLIERYPGSDGIAAVEEKAGALGVELVMKPHPMAEKVDYVVAGGDTLDKVARKFNCTKELLVTNNLIAKAALIKKGSRYRVFNGAFKVVVNKSRNDLLLTLNGRFFKRYPVGTGKFGKTPPGTYTLVERIAQPVWWREDGKAVPFGHPDNILGTHWLALKPAEGTPMVSGYGIHGTWDDASIGKAESAGCVRMHNADVEQLYVLLPVGTAVAIEE